MISATTAEVPKSTANKTTTRTNVQQRTGFAKTVNSKATTQICARRPKRVKPMAKVSLEDNLDHEQVKSHAEEQKSRKSLMILNLLPIWKS